MTKQGLHQMMTNRFFKKIKRIISREAYEIFPISPRHSLAEKPLREDLAEKPLREDLAEKPLREDIDVQGVEGKNIECDNEKKQPKMSSLGLNLKKVNSDTAPIGNFQLGNVYAGDKTVISETHFGCQMFLNLRNFDVVPTILKTGWWEPWNDKLVRSILRERDTYINCGANFGYFTLLGSWCVGSEGKTISIEANPWVFDHLMKSIIYSGMLSRTRVLNCAVGPVTGEEITLCFAPEWAGGGHVNIHDVPDSAHIPLTTQSLNHFIWPNTMEAQHLKGQAREYKSGYNELLSANVPMMSLDDICKEDISEVRLIQMDIEDAEPGAIIGAKEIISGSRDLFIIFEFGDARSRSKADLEEARIALDFLYDQGFKFYRIVPHGDVYQDFPNLQAIEKEDLIHSGHCDIFCTRN